MRNGVGKRSQERLNRHVDRCGMLRDEQEFSGIRGRHYKWKEHEIIMLGYKHDLDTKYFVNLESCGITKAESRCHLRSLVCSIKEFFIIINGNHESVLSMK